MRFLIIFLLSFNAYGGTYYVAHTASGSGDGSIGNPWTLTQAFSNVVAGDTVYIKAGTYSNLSRTFSRSGTSVAPIYFIGYKTTPGDIDEDAQTTYTEGPRTINVLSSFAYGDAVSATEMPLFRQTTFTSGSFFLSVPANYVRFYNIQIEKYDISITVSGSYNEFKNIISIDQNDPTNTYNGDGIRAYGANNTWKNIYVENAGSEAFTIRSSNSDYDGIYVISDNTTNSTGYYINFSSGSGNTLTNALVRRIGNLPEGGHGISMKASIGPTFNNIVDGFISDNTRIELQFPNCYDNEVRNGYIINRPVTTSLIEGGIRLANGSYQNTFKNIFIENAGIYFMDWDDGSPGDVDDSADDNVFNQLTVVNGYYGISFNYYGNGNFTSSADNNTFYNCTFYGQTYMFENSRANSNTQIINCIFDNITNLTRTNSGTSYPLDVTYTRTNFDDLGFATPTGTNITELDPLFVNPAADNYTLGNSSLEGIGNATPFLSAGNDLGSVQGAGGPPGDATAPSVTSQATSSVLDDRFTVEWNLDEGSKGYIRYGTSSGVYTQQTTTENNFLTFHRQTVGGNNAPLLTPGTTYYYQMYVEDLAGNTGFSSEYTQATLSSGGNPDPTPTSSTRQKGDGVYLKTKKNQ